MPLPLDPAALSVRRAPRPVRLLFALTALLVAAYCVSVLPGVVPGRPGSDAFWETWIRPAAYAGAALACAARAVFVEPGRRGWAAIAAAMLAYTAGYVGFGLVYGGDDEVPYVSFADALWLAFYPLAYTGIVLLVRERAHQFRSSMWLDGLVAGMAVAALIAFAVFDTLISEVGGEPLVVAVNIAYPICDLLLIALVAGVLGATGWRPGRAWLLLGAAMVLNSVADGIYLLKAAEDTYTEGTWLDTLWLFAWLTMAVAAWQPPSERAPQLGHWRALVVPSAATLVAVGVLAGPAFDSAHRLAVPFAAGAVIASIVRTGLTFREVRQLAESRRQAHTDDLTGLPNRRALGVRLDEALAAERSTGLLLVDLDGFKEINDVLGHAVGDVLLAQLGERLAAGMRPQDLLARLGGDEFAVVVREAGEDEAVAAAERLQALLQEPFLLDEVHVQVDASVGVALFPAQAATADELLSRADVALYQAKRDRSGIARYQPARDRTSRDRLVLAGELRAGLPRGELVLHFQPQIEIRTGRLAGLEALIRWEHPVHGLLAPGAFLPVVEQTNLMRPLTARVVADALAHAARWTGGALDVPIAVNVAAPNLLDARLPETIAGLLAAAGLPAERLQVEVTENAVMTDADRATDVLSRLGALGVAVAVDDFGTGHSSLARLKHLPVDQLKIDRGFVMQMDADERDAAIVEAAVTLARRLDLTVVAEGVETATSLQRLAELGCHQAQGFFFSRPLPAAALEAWAAGLPQPRTRTSVPARAL